jgi:RNA recognition motif. (a.k.a. RRM, RBD, or RNP domain)
MLDCCWVVPHAWRKTCADVGLLCAGVHNNMPSIGWAPDLPNLVQVRDRQTNIGKGIAFVEFKTKAAAAAALRLAEPKLHGRPLRITFLKQPKASAVAAAAAEAVPAATHKQGAPDVICRCSPRYDLNVGVLAVAPVPISVNCGALSNARRRGSRRQLCA